VAFLSPVTDAPDLSDDARELFADPGNEVYLSSVSAWEISVKNALGKLRLPDLPAICAPAQRKRHAIETRHLNSPPTKRLRLLTIA
jgi:PIN domain nuclease of toxin-antitoxin system